jgi:hypothetical protein
VIRNIPHETKVVSIMIKAVNEMGVVGEETLLVEHRMTV